MSPLSLILLFLVLSGIYAYNLILPLNNQAPFAQDVKAIKHNVQTREVSIELKTSRKCILPTLRVRMSGVSLHILNLLRVETDVLV